MAGVSELPVDPELGTHQRFEAREEVPVPKRRGV